MVNPHFTAINILLKLQSLRFGHVDKFETVHIRDNSMFPTFSLGGVVRFNPDAVVMNGDVIAIVTDEFVEIREAQVYKGQFYLVAHNPLFPRISMKDYRAIYPGAYFAGVVY